MAATSLDRYGSALAGAEGHSIWPPEASARRSFIRKEVGRLFVPSLTREPLKLLRHGHDVTPTSRCVPIMAMSPIDWNCPFGARGPRPAAQRPGREPAEFQFAAPCAMNCY